MKKKYFFLFLVCSYLLLSVANAQSNKKNSRGLFMGYGINNFKIRESNWRQTIYNDSLNSIQSKYATNISLGLLFHFNLTQYVAFRFKTQLSFEEPNLTYDKKSGKEKIKVEQTVFDLPLHVIFSTGKTNVKPYFLIGTTIRYALGIGDTAVNKLQPKRFDVTGDLGIGIELRKKQFILSPEILFSNGFINKKGDTRNLYNNVLNSYKSSIFTLVLNLRSI